MPCHGRRESQTIKIWCNRPSSSIPRTVHNRTSIVESFLEPRITQHFITTAQNVTWNPYYQHEIRFAGWKLEILDENPKSRFHGEGCPSTRTCVGCAVICYAVLCCAVLCYAVCAVRIQQHYHFFLQAPCRGGVPGFSDSIFVSGRIPRQRVVCPK